jgi:hypothetical protein
MTTAKKLRLVSTERLGIKKKTKEYIPLSVENCGNLYFRKIFLQSQTSKK